MSYTLMCCNVVGYEQDQQVQKGTTGHSTGRTPIIPRKKEKGFQWEKSQGPSSPLLLLPTPSPPQTQHLLLHLLVFFLVLLILLLPWMLLPTSPTTAPNPQRGVAKQNEKSKRSLRRCILGADLLFPSLRAAQGYRETQCELDLPFPYTNNKAFMVEFVLEFLWISGKK